MFFRMSRRSDEQAVIDRFVDYLLCETGLAWAASADEVSTNKNGRKPDCEFTCPDQRPIVADICKLFPLGSYQDDQAKRAKLIERLTPELRLERVGGLMINLPPVQRKYARPEWPKNAAVEIRNAAQQLAMHERVEVEGFSIERIADDSAPPFFCYSTLSAYQPSEAAGHPLVVLLRDKNDQLDVDNHQRFLILANEGRRANAADVSAACALIDFTHYQNFDRIYFEELPGGFRPVYHREAWLAMEARRLPEDMSNRNLVTNWLEFRLSVHWPGALDAVLEICAADNDGAAWLSEGGRAMLEQEAHLFLQHCAWNVPRQLWELFHGPVPRIFDLRRRAGSINPPVRAS